ncbi:HAMP domain-containing sensor histidine kinase [Pelagibius sp.]|uniref:sensor histidine kinase n=1 Tax=Pelagibius sp. TaxID=1931238 RepID=UPI002621DC74|nr:HAMP domain-containing sensor histidine kinase [Pelagibius sp.]
MMRIGRYTLPNAAVDIIFATLGFFLAFLVAGAFDLAEMWDDFAADHEAWEVDEIPIAVMLLTVSFGWFAWRRWYEFKAEARRRKEMNAQLEEELLRRKEIEEGLLRAQKKAEAADLAKTQFLANMSHELRTPLNATIGFAELMEREVHGPIGVDAYKDYIADIRSSGRHLLGIINDILDLTKIEAGKLDLHEEDFLLEPVVEAAVRLVTPLAQDYDITLQVEPLPGAFGLCGDPRLVTQMLTNLLSNAIRFSHPGGQVHLRSQTDMAGRCVISVSDDGIGMNAEEIDLAMKPFGQVDNVFARKRGGTGLGLPLVKALTGLHDGEVKVESTPGRGTRVSVILPSERCRANAAAVESAKAAS